MDRIIVEVARCHRQTLVNTSMNSRVRKCLESRGRWTTVSFSNRAALCLVMASINVREHRLLEAALCGDSSAFEGDKQPCAETSGV
jgi:hypothetical protein